MWPFDNSGEDEPNNDLTAADEHPPIDPKPGTVEVLDRHRVAWKALQNSLARLVIPAGTIVVYPEDPGVLGPNKLRAEKAYVEGIYSPYGHKRDEVGDSRKRPSCISRHDASFRYTQGKMVEPEEPLDATVENDCESGIHFFATKEEAEEWYR